MPALTPKINESRVHPIDTTILFRNANPNPSVWTAVIKFVIVQIRGQMIGGICDSSAVVLKADVKSQYIGNTANTIRPIRKIAWPLQATSVHEEIFFLSIVISSFI
jgi:hypothetical protein